MCSMRMSLFFRPTPVTTFAQPAQLEARIPTVNAPVPLTKPRRVLLLVMRVGSMAITKNKIHKVSEILRRHPFLQSFGHEREFGGLHFRDLRTSDDLLDAERLTNGNAARRFIHDQAGVALSVPRFDGVTKIVRCNFAVGIENIRQQLFLPAVARPRQIRPDCKSVVAETMAGLATLLEQCFAVLDVAAPLERRTKAPDDFVAIGLGCRADHLDGALLEGSIRMLPQRHRLHQR